MREDSSHYDYHLDNTFFADIDAPEIQKGKIDVSLDVRKKNGIYLLSFHTAGMVIVPCDRCLDDLGIDIDTTDELKVKLGHSYSDENDTVVIPEEDGDLNVSWFIYEFVTLSLPLKHVHAPGKCNKGMMKVLNEHLSVDAPADDENFGSESADADMESAESTDGYTDPRWDDLKKILNNNNK